MILADMAVFQRCGKEDLPVGTHLNAGKANPPLPRRAVETLHPSDPTATPLFSLSSIYIYILIIFYHILVISLLFIYF